MNKQVTNDFDLDDESDGDTPLAVTPPDVVRALGFDPLDETAELANASDFIAGTFSIPLRGYAVGSGQKANEGPFHGTTTWGCGHSTSCRCNGSGKRTKDEPCPECQAKENEGIPCGDSHISSDKECHVGQAELGSAASRFRPRERVVFDKPLVGPSGAKLVAYEWKWQPEEYVDKYGEGRIHRVSNWEDAESSGDTGRNIVHHFDVETPDGQVKTVSAESVPKLLGYDVADKSTKLPSLVSASKTMARLQMKLQTVQAQIKQNKEIAAKVKELPLPPVKSEPAVYGFGVQKGQEYGTHYIMGDYGSITRKGDYVQEDERRRILEDGWRWYRAKEMGAKSDYDMAYREKDLTKRITRQAAKIKDITTEPDKSIWVQGEAPDADKVAHRIHALSKNVWKPMDQELKSNGGELAHYKAKMHPRAWAEAQYRAERIRLDQHAQPRANEALANESYGCLMAMAPEVVTQDMGRFAREHIRTEDLAEDGIEDQNHVTIMFGFNPGFAPGRLRKLLRGLGPMEVTLGPLSRFECEAYDVLKFDVTGPWLTALHNQIAQRFAGAITPSEYPFHAHLTLAYVRKGACPDLTAVEFDGWKFEIDRLLYSLPEKQGRVEYALANEGTREGAFKGWLIRHQGAQVATDEANQASAVAHDHPDTANDLAAAVAHDRAVQSHLDAQVGAPSERDRAEHRRAVKFHQTYATFHRSIVEDPIAANERAGQERRMLLALANEGGKPCGESFIPADKQCHQGLAGHVAHFTDDAPAEHLANHVISVAKTEEPHTTRAMQSAVQAVGGRLHGLSHALKTPESLARKIQSKAEAKGLSRKEYAGRIGDALRYTIVLPEKGYTEAVGKVREQLAKDGVQTRVKGDDNKWANDDYKGLHLSVTTKNGLRSELQIHTEASLKAKAVAHKIYEQARVTKEPEARKTFAEKLRSIYRLTKPPPGAMNILA